MTFNLQYPSLDYLRQACRRRLPGFAMDYLEGGCNEELNLRRNRDDFAALSFLPRYLNDSLLSPVLDTTVAGQHYDLPFGIAPIGLQGMLWPGSPEILARTAAKRRLPFVLSTVSTGDLEEISAITNGTAWFQLYYPVDEAIRKDLIDRCKQAGYPVLVVLADTPVFGYRAKEMRNGLTLPPKLHSRAFAQILARPAWAWRTLRKGLPRFDVLQRYLPENVALEHLGQFMNQTFDGRVTRDRLAELRDLWPGKLIVKGLVAEEDVETAIGLGVDGLIVSNHGGRQLDAGESTIRSLVRLSATFKDRIELMMDGGVRSGVDVARALACGARMVFMGRPWMYGVGALGERGAEQVAEMISRQLSQVMSQVGVPGIDLLHTRLIPPDFERNTE